MRKLPLLVHLDPELLAWLREEARRRGESIGSLVREAIYEARVRALAEAPPR